MQQEVARTTPVLPAGNPTVIWLLISSLAHEFTKGSPVILNGLMVELAISAMVKERVGIIISRAHVLSFWYLISDS